MNISRSGIAKSLALVVETPSRLIVLVAVGVAVLIAGHFAYQIQEAHERAILRAERTTQSARDVLVEHTARTFETVDRAMRAVADVRTEVLRGLPQRPGAVHDLLRAIHGSSPVLFGLGWTNEQGDRLYSSLLREPTALNVAEEEQFEVHAKRRDVGLFVGRPVRSRIDGTWIVPVSRRLEDDQGNFAGIVTGGLRLDYFSGFYGTLDLGSERSVALLRRDGILLAREPVLEKAIGMSVADRPEFRQSVGRPSATLHLRRPIDGSPHILSYGVLPDLPLAVTASMSRTDALADLRRELYQQGPRVALMIVGLLLGAGMLRRQFLRREAAAREQATAAAVVHSSGDAIFYCDVAGVIRSWNNGAVALFGYSEAEILGSSHHRLLPEAHDDQNRRFATAYDRGERILGVETVRRCKDGTLVDVSLTLSPVLDERGRLIGVSTIARDISERKRAEQALGDAQQAIHAIAANVPGVVYRRVHSGDGRIVIPYFSEGLRDLTGITAEEGMADPAVVRATVPAEDLEGLNRSFAESARRNTPWAHEWRVLHRDGSVRWARGAANAPRRLANGDTVWDVVVMDATALKRAEDAQKASEARAAQVSELLRVAIESLSDGFILYDRDDRLVMMNAAARDVHPAFAAKAIPGTHLTEIVGAAFDAGLVGEPGEDRETVIRQRLAFHRRSYGKTFERRTGDRWFQVREHPTHDGGVVVIRTDVTELKRHEEALRLNEERYRALYNNTPAMMHSIDRDGRLVSVSDYWLASLGYTREEVIGRRSTDFLTPESREYARTVILPEFFRTGKCTDATYQFVKKNGEIMDTLLSSTAERDAGGNVIRSLAVIVDVTAQKKAAALLQASEARANEATARLKDAIESLSEGFLLWDSRDRLVMFNESARRIHSDGGASLIVGATFEEIMSGRVRSGLIEQAAGREEEYIQERLRRHRQPTGEPLEQQFADGRWVAVREHRTREGGVVSIRTDITELKQREAELLAARAEADAANQAKSEFLSRMSHELRTPLNAIIGFAQMLSLDRPRTLTPDQHEFCRFISSGGQHLLALVNDVLDLARIEAGTIKLSVERVSITTSLDDVRHTMAPLAEQAGIRLEVVSAEGLPDVRADELRLRQVLINLVSNAIKYNRPGGSVRLSASRNRRRVRFEIADTGLGIAIEHHAALFQPFQRLGAEHTHVEGTGIGLAICKRLVEAMRGSIGFMSEIGSGSTFWVELPADGAAAEPPPVPEEAALAAAAPRATAGGYTLLYVEDNPANLRLMEHLMSTLPSVSVLSAPTPQLGLDLAAAHRPDVIVLDLNLPGMSGYEMLARLKGMPEIRGVPIMALTAAALPKDIERGLAAGFFRYLTKPIDVKQFLGAVDDALAQTPRWIAAAS